MVQACIVAGDEMHLAEWLELPVKAVVDWLLGDAAVPTEVFLRAVDVVLASTGKQVGDISDLLEQIKLRHHR